jgi:hypothetical protein
MSHACKQESPAFIVCLSFLTSQLLRNRQSMVLSSPVWGYLLGHSAYTILTSRHKLTGSLDCLGELTYFTLIYYCIFAQ